jgi:uncharacterized protein
LGCNLKRYGNWCLVTGASSGIGLEFAKAVAAEGLNVILTARRQDRLEALAAELRERNRVEVVVIGLDLGLPGAADELCARLGDREVDVLVLNAGFGFSGRFVDQGEENITRMITLNCTNTALLARKLLPGMLGRGRGAVIIVSSVLGFIPGPETSVYAATKAFDLFLGESLSPELKGTGVDLINLCPGMTRTEFHYVARGGADLEDRAERWMDDPSRVAHLALAGLGRKVTVTVAQGLLSSLVVRLLPRGWVSALMGLLMRSRHVGRSASTGSET